MTIDELRKFASALYYEAEKVKGKAPELVYHFRRTAIEVYQLIKVLDDAGRE